MIQPPCRPATQQDAAALAELVNMAGEGLPLHIWSRMADAGQDPWEIGRQRAGRDSGSFSYRNAFIREKAGRVVAALIGYPLADAPVSPDLSQMPPMFVPLQELEDLAPGTWYVNVLATLPEYRGQGYGSQLLALAEKLATASGRRGLSIIVADGNFGAIRLYSRVGFRQTDSRPLVSEDWDTKSRNWVLMTKALNQD
jgi:ribosomal protein S18 acetylase RimI-like enzyme